MMPSEIFKPIFPLGKNGEFRRFLLENVLAKKNSNPQILKNSKRISNI